MSIGLGVEYKLRELVPLSCGVRASSSPGVSGPKFRSRVTAAMFIRRPGFTSTTITFSMGEASGAYREDAGYAMPAREG